MNYKTFNTNIMASNKYITKEELALFQSMNPIFSPEQMDIINKRTPPPEIEEKEENGRKYKTVKSHYAKKIAFIVLGGQYNFEIKDQKVIAGKEIKTDARLTIYSNGRIFFRDQNGTYKGIICSDGFKASASDAFKKCLSEFGFFWDIYGQEIEEVKESKTELSYEDKIQFDKLKQALIRCDTINDLDFEFAQFEEKSNCEIFDLHKDLYKENYDRINKK